MLRRKFLQLLAGATLGLAAGLDMVPAKLEPEPLSEDLLEWFMRHHMAPLVGESRRNAEILAKAITLPEGASVSGRFITYTVGHGRTVGKHTRDTSCFVGL